MASKPPLCVPVILSGGTGTRLWPMSRENYPKQFLHLGSPKYSLIQETVLRVRDRAMFAPPVLVCNKQHRFLVAETLNEIGIKDAVILLEPEGRNTAPALATAAHYIRTHYGDSALMLVLPSDHIITSQEDFLHAVTLARHTASQGYLAAFGIKPVSPEIGYGYIKYGVAIDGTEGFTISEFVEKPDKETAKSYLNSKSHAWNSGMFCFPTGLFLYELEKLQPEMAALAEQASLACKEESDFIWLNEDAFKRIKANSIDYAVMEKTSRAAVIPMKCGWTDAGSFDALWEIKPRDSNGNALSGEAYLIDTHNCYISCNDGVQVATLGIHDLVIISTKDCIMVADKKRTQEVRILANAVKQQNPDLVEKYRQVYRPWGHYDNIDIGERHQVKRIVIKPGASISLQMHYHRAEHWVVVSGSAIVTRDEKREVVTEDQSLYIPVGTKHRIENPGKIPLEIIEVQSGSYLGEDDIVRFADTYGRTTDAA